MSVQLIIKSAAQNVEDFKLDCDLAWSIGQVKEKIAVLYPTKPIKEHQKLIYGGKLLPDHLPLSSVLNQLQEVHTMHIVCPLPPKTEMKPTKEETPKSDLEFTVPSPNVSQTQINPNLWSTQNFSSSGIPFNGGVPTANAIHQYLAMQQMYSQFMTQYLSQMNGNVSNITSNVTQPTQPVPQEPPPVRVQNEAAARPQAEEGDQDYLFVLSRGVMLFALLYYYSSVPRVLLVVSLAIIFSLYMKIKRDYQAENRHRVQENASSETLETQNQNMDAQSTESASQVTSENSSANDTPNQSQNVISTLTTVFSLVSSFFSSLIPTDPVPVNVN